MALLNKADILKANDIVKETVSVPEWGGEVMVKCLTGAERDKFESSILSIKGKEQSVNLSNIRAKLCSMSICDETGARLFAETDVQALSQKSSAALDRVFTVAQRLSGLNEDDVDKLAEALEEAPLEGSPSA